MSSARQTQVISTVYSLMQEIEDMQDDFQDELKNESLDQKFKETKCGSFCKKIKNASVISFRLGMFYERRYYFTPIWAVVVSYAFYIGIVSYFAISERYLFQKILNVNTYKLMRNADYVLQATNPDYEDLFPIGLTTDLRCEDVEVIYTV